MSEKKLFLPEYKIDIITGIAFGVFALFMLIIGPSEIIGARGADQLGFSPLLFPNMIMGAILLGSLVTIYRGLKSRPKAAELDKDDAVLATAEEGSVLLQYVEIKNFFVMVLAFILYVVAMRYLGFIICTPILVGFSIYYLKERSPIKIIAGGVIITVLLVLFANALRLVLPTGTIIYRLLY